MSSFTEIFKSIDVHAVSTLDSSEIDRVIALLNHEKSLRRPKDVKPVPDPLVVATTTYTDLWDQWKVSAPLRSVRNEYLKGGVIIVIENNGNKEQFAVTRPKGRGYSLAESYEVVAKVAWRRSKLKDC